MKQDPVDILWQRARAAPTSQPDLQGTWRRLETQPAPPTRWPLGAALAIGLSFCVVAMQVSPSPAVSPAPEGLHEATPRFMSQRWTAPPAAAATRLPVVHRDRPTAPAASTTEAQPMQTPRLSADSKAPEPPVSVVQSKAPNERSGQVPARVSTYQPRAIVEFRRIDWSRWQAQALPTAVAQMVQLRDSRGLLALLDTMPLRRENSPLLMLRGQLRAQARRCADAQADMQMLSDAGPSDLQILCRP